MPLPRPPRTSNGRPEKKWVEARRRAGDRVPAKKYMFRMSSGLSVQDADTRACLQELPPMEDTTEDPMGGGARPG